MANPATEPYRPKRSHEGQRDYAATISTLNASAEQCRAQSIGAVIAAYGRLRESVSRFVSTIAKALGDTKPDAALASRSFDDLLTALEEHASAIGFGRMDALAQAIRAARSAEQQRNSVFEYPSSIDVAALAAAASTLEWLDKTFVGLCVEHVMEEHRRGALANAYLD